MVGLKGAEYAVPVDAGYPALGVRILRNRSTSERRRRSNATRNKEGFMPSAPRALANGINPMLKFTTKVECRIDLSLVISIISLVVALIA